MFHPWVGKTSWRRKWQPNPAFQLGKLHGHRSLASYGSWDRKESDMTERLSSQHCKTRTRKMEEKLHKILFLPLRSQESIS